jgi:hypothetical protein
LRRAAAAFRLATGRFLDFFPIFSLLSRFRGLAAPFLDALAADAGFAIGISGNSTLSIAAVTC